MTNLTLSREMQNMAERLAENSHDIWAKKKKDESGATVHPQLVPYDLLTDKEKKKDRERSQEFLKYLQYQGYKLHKWVAMQAASFFRYSSIMLWAWKFQETSQLTIILESEFFALDIWIIVGGKIFGLRSWICVKFIYFFCFTCSSV